MDKEERALVEQAARCRNAANDIGHHPKAAKRLRKMAMEYELRAAGLEDQKARLKAGRRRQTRAKSVDQPHYFCMAERPTVREESVLRPRRSRQSESLQDRLMKFAKEAREKASRLPPGPEKDDMLRRARQADTASHMDD
jgi:hypothetical protein